MAAAQAETLWLTGYRNPMGGIAYLAGRQPRIEPTALAVIAGAAQPADVDWLKKKLPAQLTQDGGPTLDPTGSILETARRPWLVALGIVALARASSESVQPDVAACIEYLRDNHAADAWGNVNETAEPELAGALPWNVRNYGWVEPTCWGLYAELALLTSATENDEKEKLYSNIAARIEFLMTRKVSGQGWNNGDLVKFGTEIPPYPQETAMVLAALAGVKNIEKTASLFPVDFDVAASFALLEGLQSSAGSRLSQSWLHIASKAWRQQSAQRWLPAIGSPTVGESSVDALLALAARVEDYGQGFNFLHPTGER